MKPLKIDGKNARPSLKVTVAIVIDEGENKSSDVDVYVFEIDKAPALTRHVSVTRSELEAMLGDCEVQFSATMSRKSWAVCKEGASGVAKEVLARRVVIAGDFREYARVAHNLPSWIADCACKIR